LQTYNKFVCTLLSDNAQKIYVTPGGHVMDAQAFWNVIGNYNQSTLIWQCVILALIITSLILAYLQKVIWLPKIAFAIGNIFIGIVFFLIYGTEPIQTYFAAPLYLIIGFLFMVQLRVAERWIKVANLYSDSELESLQPFCFGQGWWENEKQASAKYCDCRCHSFIGVFRGCCFIAAATHLRHGTD